MLYNDFSEIPDDEKLVAVALRSLLSPDGDEEIISQFLIAATGTESLTTDPFHAVGRLGVFAATEDRAGVLAERVKRSYRALNVSGFRRLHDLGAESINDRYWPRHYRNSLTAEALALVTLIPLMAMPGLALGKGRRLAPDTAIPDVGPLNRVLATSNYVDQVRALSLTPKDRLSHLYVYGPSDRGKTRLLLNLIRGDIEDGFGVMVIDPKGELAQLVIDHVEPGRIKDVIFINLSTDWPVGFQIAGGTYPRGIGGLLLGVFADLTQMGSSAAPRAKNALRPILFTITTLGMTFVDIPRLLAQGRPGERLRAEVLTRLEDIELKRFWQDFEGLSAKEKFDIVAPILHRFSAFTLYPELRLMLGQKPGITMERVLAENKIVIVNLNAGLLSEDLSRMLGTLLLASFWAAVLARDPEKAKEFFLYVDEFASVVDLPVSYSRMVEMARSQKVGLTVANQELSAIPEDIRKSIFANTANKVAFRAAEEDVAKLAKAFGDSSLEKVLQNLGDREVLMRLTSDKVQSSPVTARTLNTPMPYFSTMQVLAASRQNYARKGTDVQAELDAFEARYADPPESEKADEPAIPPRRPPAKDRNPSAPRPNPAPKFPTDPAEPPADFGWSDDSFE